MRPIALLAQIIAHRDKVSSSRFRELSAFQHLVKTGYVECAGMMSSVGCTECEEAHDAELVFEEGQYGYFCPSLGFVPVQREDAQAVKPDVAKLIAALAVAFQCKRRKATVLQDSTWRIGAIETVQGDVLLLFHPNLQDETDLRALCDAFSREMRSSWRLIVTAEGAMLVEGATTVNLGELVDLDTSDGSLVPLSDPCSLVGVPKTNPGGAPNRFGPKLTTLIEDRMQKGKALSGRNEEAKAILEHFGQKHPDLTPPSLSTVKDYVSKLRAGQ